MGQRALPSGARAPLPRLWRRRRHRPRLLHFPRGCNLSQYNITNTPATLLPRLLPRWHNRPRILHFASGFALSGHCRNSARNSARCSHHVFPPKIPRRCFPASARNGRFALKHFTSRAVAACEGAAGKRKRVCAETFFCGIGLCATPRPPHRLRALRRTGCARARCTWRALRRAPG